MNSKLEPGFESLNHVICSGEVDFKSPLNLSNLQGKTILITGGASGFGAACAELWAQHGANVMIGDINTKMGAELVARLRSSTKNDSHHFFPCDVASWQSQASFFKEAARASPHGGLDIVLANAGIADGGEGMLFEDPPDYSNMENPAEPLIMRTLDINLKGVYFTTHLALSYLPRNPGSKPCSLNGTASPRDRQLILVSSIAGVMPILNLASYCSAKHGVVGLFRCLRATAPIVHGVRVNMINPYFVKTPIMNTDARLALAGGAPGEVGDVIGALTRFVTDQSIIGRGLVVGPKANEDEAKLANLPHGGPIWDVYADDFGQTDLFTRRVIALVNLRTQARGWSGLLKDVFVSLTSPIRRRFFG